MKNICQKIHLTLLLMLCMVFMTTTTAKAAVTSTPLSLNNTWVSTTLTDDDNPQYYKITLPTAGTLTLTYQSFADYTYWGLYSEDLETEFFEYSVSGGSPTSPETKTATYDLEPGTYLIKIYPLSSSYAGDVRIKGSFEKANANDVEPNNTFSDAMAVAGNTTVNAFLAHNDEYDFYKISVPKTGTIEFSFSTAIDLNIYLYSADYEELEYKHVTTYNNKVNSSFKKVLKAGTYYVKVQDHIYTGCYDFMYNNVVPTAIKLESSSLTLSEGKEVILGASLTPANAVVPDMKWTSSDEDVVDITSYGGKDYIRGQGLGVATVTLATTDGSNVSASCKVIVAPDKVSFHATSKKKNSITLSWEELDGVDGYRVYKYNTSTKKFVKYKDTTKDYLTIKKLKPEKKYKFQVVAYMKVNGQKVFGEVNASKSYWTAPKVLKASKITSIKKYRSDSHYTYINVKWKKVSGATGYQVYGKIPGSDWEFMGSTKKRSMKLYAGKGYTYSIKVRPYRTKHGATTYGKWSKVKKYSSR